MHELCIHTRLFFVVVEDLYCKVWAHNGFVGRAEGYYLIVEFRVLSDGIFV